MNYEDLLIGSVLFLATIPIWFLLYYYFLADILADNYVKKIESGQIDLNYLLDEGGVFEALTERIVKRFREHMLAEMGQLAQQSKGGILEGVEDPINSGLEISGMILNQLGMKKPPAMLQYKLANVLGTMLNAQTQDINEDSSDTGRFYPK